MKLTQYSLVSFIKVITGKNIAKKTIEQTMYFVAKILSFLVSFLLFRSCSSIDTITPNQPMKDGDILASNDGSFALGFFSPISSRNRYVGIWYNKVSEQTVVWVANRDNPITDFSGVLSISGTGNLLLHEKKRENISVWSANVSSMTATKASSAQLLDNGNLVLLQGRVVVWQSFDYPTDTLLPGMKLGVDRRTGLNRFLTSWKSSEDPGTGEYSYKMDPNGSPQIFLSKGSVRIWRTGPWVGLQWSGIPEKLSNFIFNTSYVDNEDEVYVVNYLHNASVLSRLVVKQSGVIEMLTWTEGGQRWVRYASAPGDKCDSYGHCGAYGNCDPYSNPDPFECTCLPGFEPKSEHDWYLRDGSKGCVRKNGENLCGHREGFVTVAHARVPDTLTARANKNMGMKACKELCLSNCSCTGYASADVNGTGNGCITWYEDLIDTRQFLGWGQDLYIRVSAVELALYSKKSKSLHRKKLVAIVVVSFTAMFLILSLVYALAMKKRKGKRRSPKFPGRRNSSLFSEGPSGSGEKEINESETNTDLQFFDLSSVVVATENFSISNRLGEGGFGTVYKGRLDNGQEIAVKRLSTNSRQGLEELKNEVKLIAKLQHRNLVRLLGCCIQEEEKMLIYEYLPNKCLDSFIFDKEKRAMVDWRKRFEIILGITRGMIYLHEDSRLRIIHRDLKTSNVLLDATMNPKISDFGMAKIFDGDQIEANTKRVVGTYGYMAPEYAMEGLFSIKSDVYSFGVMLLEIISGKKNNSYYEENSLNLVGHVWNLWKKSRALDVVDSSLGKSYQAHEVLRCIHIGLLCVQEFAVDRPTMSEVAFMLSHETILPSPNQPAFIFKRANNGPGKSSAYVGVDSVNGVTLTAVQAR